MEGNLQVRGALRKEEIVEAWLQCVHFVGNVAIHMPIPIVQKNHITLVHHTELSR